MNWNWIYVALGGTFIITLIEKGRTQALIVEAQQRKQVTQKPIMLISSSPRQGFDVYLNPSDVITWQLPYTNKAFAAVVSDALEEIPYPQEAMTEWERVADIALINTHSIFSPETWLDFRHHYVFMGQNAIPINPAMNWAIASGVGYYFYRRHKRLRQAEEREALPEPELEEEEEYEEAEPQPERKALPPPIEPAPIITSPEELSGMENEAENEKTGKRESGKTRKQENEKSLSLRKGSRNFTIGELDAEVKMEGVENLLFDPTKMPEEHNQQVLEQLTSKPADSATLFGVLDKVTDPEERKSALQVAHENVKSGGKVYIKVKEPKKYLTEVKQVFPGAKISKGMITAVN